MNLSKQCQIVLNHIRAKGYISQLVATNYGVTRLASRIHDLKLAGYDIVPTAVKDMAGKRYTRYSFRVASMLACNAQQALAA